MIRWYVKTTAHSFLSVGLPMMVLYAEGSATTMNDTNSVFDLGSSPMVTGRTAVPAGETESPMNPVSIIPISKGDLRVLAPSRPLFDRGPGVGFPGRGTVSPGCRSTDDDIYLLFNWLIRSGGGVLVPTGPFLGGSSISDEPMKMPLVN
ncbi:hypothetical protein B296_00014913 [Ensete ventricosum]|uniref:Pectate lyase superfamily protein domain-containing protein n=1 Tax=Ensete ventricosum TaxID=4639 RepID=A0A426Y4H6_ENSVE|nr:hypothetical protein B296_00014913 [Ensete ventricosum]